MLITPISSPTTIFISNDASTTQPEVIAEDDNIFNLPKTSLALSHQDNWHVPMVALTTIARIHAAEGAAITKAGKLLDSKAKNWSGWSQLMVLLFTLFGVQEYVQGKIICLDLKDNPESAENWTYNNTFAQLLIMSNIYIKERVHTSGCTSAHHMWLSLQSIHESKSHLILTMHLRMLMNTVAAEDDNIIEHLIKLKHYWDQLSLFRNKNYCMSEFLFKHIIASSLSESWDQFTDQFVAGQLDFIDTDPKKHMDMQQFIGIIKQEHKHRQLRKPMANKLPEQAMYTQGCSNAKLPLASWISGNANDQRHFQSSKKYCNTCQHTNHWTSQCRFAGKPKCEECGRFGHMTNKCWNTTGNKCPFERSNKGDSYLNKRSHKDMHNTDAPVQANNAKMEEHIIFNAEHDKLDDKGETTVIIADKSDVVEEPTALTADNDKSDIIDNTYDGEYYNFDHVPSSDEMDMCLIYYNWLADTAATLHITH